VYITPDAVRSRQRTLTRYISPLRTISHYWPYILLETEMPPGLDLQIGSIQAIMRYRMTAASYHKLLVRALPGDLKAGAPRSTDIYSDPATTAPAAVPEHAPDVIGLGQALVEAILLLPHIADVARRNGIVRQLPLKCGEFNTTTIRQLFSQRCQYSPKSCMQYEGGRPQPWKAPLSSIIKTPSRIGKSRKR